MMKQGSLCCTCLTLLVCVGCAAVPPKVDAPQAWVTLGGIFWPTSTPGYVTEKSDQPWVKIPKGAACDVRVHPGGQPGRARVRVKRNDRWVTVWVDRVPSRDFAEIHFLPFLTFTYVGYGTESVPSADWSRSEPNLLAAAVTEREQLTDAYLRGLLGFETFRVYTAPPPHQLPEAGEKKCAPATGTGGVIAGG